MTLSFVPLVTSVIRPAVVLDRQVLYFKFPLLKRHFDDNVFIGSAYQTSVEAN